MDDIGGDALTWYHDVLHANFINDDTNDLTLYGEPADPIGDGLSINIGGGDGANNETYPSDIDPRDAAASIVLRYDATRNGGIKVDTGTYRLVYFAFGFEAINNAAHRALVMQRVIDWLAPASVAVPTGDTPPAADPGRQLAESLQPQHRDRLPPRRRDARRARRLRPPGPPRAHPRGRPASRGRAPRHSGTAATTPDARSRPGSYLYRITGGGTEQSGRMMLVK